MGGGSCAGGSYARRSLAEVHSRLVMSGYTRGPLGYCPVGPVPLLVGAPCFGLDFVFTLDEAGHRVSVTVRD